MFLTNPMFTIHLFTLDYEKTMVVDSHTQLEGEDGVRVEPATGWLTSLD